MKHLILTFFFVILCLGQGQSYAQDKTNPAEFTPPTSVETPEAEAQHKPSKKKPVEDNANEQSPPLVEVNGQKVSIDSGTDKNAENANIISIFQALFGFGTLVLAGFATCYAKRAWLAARRGVDVTRDIGQKQTQAYLSVKSAMLWVPVWGDGQKGWRPKNGHFHFTLAPIFENTGNTPARNVEYKFKVRLFGGGENLLESDFGETREFGVVGHKSDTSGALTFLVSTNVPVQDIDPINTISIRTCYITIRAEYSDVFDNRWYIESRFEGAPHTDSIADADNVMNLNLDHITAADEHGKVEED